MNTKESLRSRYRHERQERYVEHNFEILLETPEIQRAHVIASYHSYGFEPDTNLINQKLIEAGKTLLLPRTTTGNIEWVRWDGQVESLTLHKKFKEPMGEAESNLSLIDVVLVPALRVDREGVRLGQGGGFYDRALPEINAWKIALIHPDELSGDSLPEDPWDVRVNAVATPDLILRIN